MLAPILASHDFQLSTCQWNDIFGTNNSCETKQTRMCVLLRQINFAGARRRSSLRFGMGMSAPRERGE
jgi:hypothetical protein